jgi:hypothetical protein
MKTRRIVVTATIWAVVVAALIGATADQDLNA